MLHFVRPSDRVVCTAEWVFASLNTCKNTKIHPPDPVQAPQYEVFIKVELYLPLDKNSFLFAAGIAAIDPDLVGSSGHHHVNANATKRIHKNFMRFWQKPGSCLTRKKNPDILIAPLRQIGAVRALSKGPIKKLSFHSGFLTDMVS